MLQLWVLPEIPGQSAGYKNYQPQWGDGLTRIYGGGSEQDDTFASSTLLEVALAKKGETFVIGAPCLAYLSQGHGTDNGTKVSDGDLLRDDQLSFHAADDVQLVVVRTNQ